MTKNTKLAGLITSGTLLAAGSGYLAAAAISASTQNPTTTTTVNLATGERGPAGPPGPPGPQGPQGPAGEVSCGTGYQLGLLVINHPGGQTTIKTCIKNP